jgi:hypothetical protein
VFPPQTPAPALLVVVSGGRNSCKVDGAGIPHFGRRMRLLHADVRELDARLHEAGADARLFVSCFGPTADTVVVEPPAAPGRHARLATDAFIAGLAKLATQRTRVLLYGHSYGGWLVTRIGLALRSAGVAHLDRLVTIDPISPLHCSPGTYWRHIAGHVESLAFTSILPVIGCDRFPPDIDAQAAADLGRYAGRWVNAYQLRWPFLHSAPQPAAHANLLLEDPQLFAAPHDAAILDAQVLGPFRAAVLDAAGLSSRDLSKAPSPTPPPP